MENTFTFDQLDKLAQKRAVDQYLSEHTYPNWDDVSMITEMLQEWADNVFGLASLEINWNTKYKYRVGFTGTFSWVDLERAWKRKELTDECDYGGYTGAQIRTMQEELLKLYNGFLFACKLVDTEPDKNKYGDEYWLTFESQPVYRDECDTQISRDNYNSYPESMEYQASLIEDKVDAYINTARDILSWLLESDIDYNNSEENAKERLQEENFCKYGSQIDSHGRIDCDCRYCEDEKEAA